jgi:glycosyltransferase involved in cell wall biosynthesis
MARPATVIVDALAARFGGTAYAAIQTSRRLAECAEIEEVLVVAGQGSIVEEGLRDAHSVRLHSVTNGPPQLIRRVAWEASALRRLAGGRHRASVLSWSGMLPRRVPARLVCHVSNPLLLYGPGAANALRRWTARRTAAGAAHVLVPSQALVPDAERALRRTPEVVPLGVDHAHFTPADQPRDELLCVADFYPHKHHEVVLLAWAALPEPRPTLRLIGDGRVDARHHRRILGVADALRDRGTIEVEHGLTLSELIAAYRAARVFVLPSRHESFAMPVIEAQACGVPPVLRDTPVLRETGGPGATYVEGDDPRAWSRAVLMLLQATDTHNDARSAALANAKRFSWERTTDELRTRLLSSP